MIFHQHISPRNNEVVKAGISVVFCVKPLLWPNISSLDSRKCFECLWVTNGYQEGMQPMIFSINYKLSKQSCMGAMNPKVTNPPLSRTYCGTIDCEGLIFFVVGGCGL